MTTGSSHSTDGLSRYLDFPLVHLGVAALLVMMFATVVSTIGNALFSRPVPDMVTIDEILMAFVVFLPLAFVQLQREHIEVAIATDWLPPRQLARLRIFGCVVSMLAFAMLFWGLALGAWESWIDNDLYTGEYEFPSWPIRSVAALGVLGFLIRIAADIAQTLRALRQPGTTDSSTTTSTRP